MFSIWRHFWVLVLVIACHSDAVSAQRGTNNRGSKLTCAEFGAVERDSRCIYPVLADCRRKPTDTARAAVFQCPKDTTCEPITGLCVCRGEYKNTDDKDNILTCIQGQNYDQPCNASETCLERFQCLNGKCLCPTPGQWNATEGECINDKYCKGKYQDSFYEEATKQCKCLINGETCGSVPDGAQQLGCPLNSRHQYVRVGRRHRCECTSGFTPSGSRQNCLDKLGYDQPCAGGETDACDTRKGLSCRGGKCACDPASRTWHTSGEECRLKAGQQCEAGLYGMPIYGQCEANADCTLHGYGPNAVRTCDCDDGFQVGADGLCKAAHGTGCRSEGVCIAGLDCIEGTCDCRDQISSVFQAGSCKTLVGARCNSTSVCVANAECLARSVCECKPGFRLNPGTRGQCMATFGYGEACEKAKCDFDRGYTCKSGKCACADSFLTYKGPQEGCVAPVGYECGSHLVRGVIYKIGCDANAECRRVSGENEQARSICFTK